MSAKQVPMAEADVLEQVKRITEADDVQVHKKVTDFVWVILVAHVDGAPDADGNEWFKFSNRLVDVEGPEVRIIGFNW